MIVKHVPMRSAGKSDFAGLAQYVSNDQGIQERLGVVRITNCQAETFDAATAEVLATQQMNTRATGDKTYHLLVSFRAGEQPTPAVLAAIEDRVCDSLGFAGHQRISAVHHDTDNLHIHIAISKIHPDTLTMQEPFKAYRTLADLAGKLEKEYGLQADNHVSTRTVSEGRAKDMEQHSGIESLIGWVQRECLAEIRQAASWTHMHEVLAANGLAINTRANGLVVVATDGTTVKASSIARDLSKPGLEKKLGPFVPWDSPASPGDFSLGAEGTEHRPQRLPERRSYSKSPIKIRFATDELYARYQSETAADHKFRKWRVSDTKAQALRQVEIAKERARFKRRLIKLFGGSRYAKKVFYEQTSKTLRSDLRQIVNARERVKAETFSARGKLSWADWLKKKALEGDADALQALRARPSAGLRGNSIKAVGSAVPVSRPVDAVEAITKKGTVIYRNGAIALRDDGERLQVARQATKEALSLALDVAVKRYGSRITVEGSPEFKARLLLAAVDFTSPITFSDPVLERKRIELTSKRNSNEPEQSAPNDRGRTIGGRASEAGRDATRAGSNGITSAVTGSVTGSVSIPSGAIRRTAKPNVGRVGRVPPPFAKDRLRGLSELGLVRLSDGSAVLLPGDVPSVVEQQKAERDSSLRRDDDRTGSRGIAGALSAGQLAAIDKYVAERVAKRVKMSDIPKHSRYNGGVKLLTFAGIRHIDGHILVLLKQKDEVQVSAVDADTANKLKRMKLGEPITFTEAGAISVRKGRSR